jgi:predicted RND superfamily exporter protein
VVPLLAATSLLVGMAWSFGWLVLSVGHLQLLSVVFSVILLGLGIDFALHLVARLELVQDEHDDLPSAASRVFRGIGPGMLTGAVTTAAAFGATALTQFKGMAEMGIIAGGGILLCLVAVLTSFPAALAATGRWKRVIRHRPGGERAHFAGGSFDHVDFHPKMALAVALVVVALVALPALRVRYDPNVLNLQPPDIESVRWEKRIVEDDSGSVWSAIVETDAAAAPALVDRLRALPEVSEVSGMGVLLPGDRAARAARIAAVRSTPPPDLPDVEPGVTELRRRLGLVLVGLERRRPGTDAATAARIDASTERIGDALTASALLDASTAAARTAALEAAFASARAALVTWVDAALAPVPPAPEDLPRMLREQWRQDGVWLLRVHPAADSAGRSILHPDRLGDFVAAVGAVAPNVLGPPVQIYESSELIKREYVKAAVFAVAAILVLLLLDFRSLGDTLCAMLPVTIGFIGVFGIMGIGDVPLNFANIIVMPLIFGIGVDAGVHAVHRWRAEPYGRPAGLSGGTGRGITLTMTSTMIGFGCMLVAEHRGIRSLGYVMLAGLGVTLAACCTVLPAVLRLRTSHWTDERQ